MSHRYWPGVTLLPFGGEVPQTSSAAFVAPGTRIIGAVTLGEESSIWV
jgi:carbonic anhydrase/acetyltransferase-like protein (isoleucine patch superfamily)